MGEPIIRRIHTRHSQEKNGQDVGEAKVENEDLDQRPILLIVVILNEVHLQLLHFVHAIRQFQQHDHSKGVDDLALCHEVKEYHEQIEAIYLEFVFEVVAADLPDGLKFPSKAKPDSDEVEDQLKKEN